MNPWPTLSASLKIVKKSDGRNLPFRWGSAIPNEPEKSNPPVATKWGV
jgi:hypothetical protein